LLLAGCATAAAPEELVKIPGTSIALEMVYVPASTPFWISKREITWGEFDRFYQFPEEQRIDGITRPSSGKNYLQLSGVPAEGMQDHLPVTNLRYHSAVSYCEWLSKKTGMIFRLPTEAEWSAAPGDARVGQYCFEPDRPPDFGPVLRGTGPRTAPPEWDQADPNRPVSTWWYRTGNAQGFRVVRVPEGGAGAAPRIEILDLKGEERVAKAGGQVSIYSRVTGEVRNASDRPVDELVLKVYNLDPRGNPHFEDVTSNLTRRATFNVCAPALRNSAHAGGPLRPGERRRFAVDLPMTFDADSDVAVEKFGASILHVRFGD
jgi:hypothetical protein